MAILTYHHIGHPPECQRRDHPGLWVSPELFRAQLTALRTAGHVPVTMDDISQSLSGAAPLPPRWVAVTFDDGWRDNLTEAAPILREAGFTATIFMVTSAIAAAAETRTGGQPAVAAWEDRLSAADMTSMVAEGTFRFGGHSHTHPRMARLADDECRAELSMCRDTLAAILGAPPRHFAYPYGSFSRRTAALAAEAGFVTACSTIRDNRVSPEQAMWLPRVMVMHDTTPARLRYMLGLTYHWVHAWKNRRRWTTLRDSAAETSRG